MYEAPEDRYADVERDGEGDVIENAESGRYRGNLTF